MLSESEFDKIFNWLPYRETWPVDGNASDDGIYEYYGLLIEEMTNNAHFSSEQTQNGGMSNYLEFICYPKGEYYNGPAIMSCISLCAPIAAYGETTFRKDNNFLGWGSFIQAERVGNITQESLIPIETNILQVLQKNGVKLITKEFASKYLPDGFFMENLNWGNQYLHGLFQWVD